MYSVRILPTFVYAHIDLQEDSWCHFLTSLDISRTSMELGVQEFSSTELQKNGIIRDYNIYNDS